MAEPLPADDNSLRRVIEALARPGFQLRIEDHGGYDGYSIVVERVESFSISQRLLDRLGQEGWIERYGARGWKLSDEGRKAYMRSTDELGDGCLQLPASGDS